MNQPPFNRNKKNRGEAPAENVNSAVNYSTLPEITKRKLYNFNLLALRDVCDHFIKSGHLLSEDKDHIFTQIRENRALEKQINDAMEGGNCV